MLLCDNLKYWKNDPREHQGPVEVLDTPTIYHYAGTPLCASCRQVDSEDGALMRAESVAWRSGQ